MLLADVKTKIVFEPAPTPQGPAKWRVRVVFPSGKQIQLGAFASEAEAEEWIALKSSEWSQLRECERSFFRAGSL